MFNVEHGVAHFNSVIARTATGPTNTQSALAINNNTRKVQSATWLNLGRGRSSSTTCPGPVKSSKAGLRALVSVRSVSRFSPLGRAFRAARVFWGSLATGTIFGVMSRSSNILSTLFSCCDLRVTSCYSVLSKLAYFWRDCVLYM